MRKLVAGNWKMNGLTAASLALADGIAAGAGGIDCDLLICPPFTQIAALAARLRGGAVRVGGQDCHVAAAGAHTGDVSADMLADAGCSAVIVGHSERRADHGETDGRVRAKAVAAARAGLMPIVCVGETEAERDAGMALAVVERQVGESLPDDFAGVLAYEPVWAIGTGRTPTEADVASMHLHIRGLLVARFGVAGVGLRILYGGSVKPDNAGALLAVTEVGGALVGGAALSAAGFLAIAAAAAGR